MNLLIVKEAEIAQDQSLCISGRRAEHLISVLKVAPGSHVRAGVISGAQFKAEVTDVSELEVRLSMGEELAGISHSNIDLILALPRPQTLKKVLETTAAMGVRRLVLTRSNRVEKSFFQSSLLEPENIEKHLLLGLEQGGSTYLPEVVVCERFNSLVDEHIYSESRIPRRGPSTELRALSLPANYLDKNSSLLLADPNGKNSLSDLNLRTSISPDQHITLAVGPEGGWVDHEIAQFEKNGFTSFTLGERILRVETAVCSLLAQIDLLRQLRQL